MGDSREPSRRVGERGGRSHFRADRDSGRGARARRVGEGQMEAETDRYLLRVGWGRARATGLDGMGRTALRRIARARGGVYQFGFEWTRLFRCGSVTHFSDTDFVYGRALAQAGGTAMMRLADADLLPFEFGDFADTVQTYLKELKTLAQKTQEEIRERNREIEEGVFQATNDPKRPLVPPTAEAVPPHLNFAPMENAVDALNRSAAEYRKALEQVNAKGSAAPASASLALR